MKQIAVPRYSLYGSLASYRKMPEADLLSLRTIRIVRLSSHFGIQIFRWPSPMLLWRLFANPSLSVFCLQKSTSLRVSEKLRRAALLVVAVLAVSPSNARAQTVETKDELRGVEFVTPVKCADTTLTSLQDRFGGTLASLNASGMRADYGNGVSVTSYEMSQVAALQRKGERVQTCFLGGVEGTPTCIPSDDRRGRVYRIYVYRLHAAFTAMNSSHACGGA